ncbi:hypothetical protein [Falsiroseomonas sp.]|uniref:hypothetical protein n=1 Tax=Falsiroseomonas sp. TaxID=2870721 RepID=UPI003562F19F
MPNDLGAWLPDWWTLAAVAAPFAVAILHRQMAREMDANDRAPAPEDHQVRWHVRHIRQDLALVAYLLMAILVVLIVIAARLSGGS